MAPLLRQAQRGKYVKGRGTALSLSLSHTHTHTHTRQSHTLFFLSPPTDRQIDRGRLSCFIFLFSDRSAVDNSEENSLQSARAGSVPRVAETNKKMLFFPNGAHSVTRSPSVFSLIVLFYSPVIPQLMQSDLKETRGCRISANKVSVFTPATWSKGATHYTLDSSAAPPPTWSSHTGVFTRVTTPNIYSGQRGRLRTVPD